MKRSATLPERIIQPVDEAIRRQVEHRLDHLTKPRGSLGRLEALVAQVAAIQGSLHPTARRKHVVVMVGDHGVVAEGVSAYPACVTTQMVANFLEERAAVNVLARQVGAQVLVVDMGMLEPGPPHPRLLDRHIRRGTGNIAAGPAMSRQEAHQAIQVGQEVAAEIVAAGADLLATGEMGIGNTTPSSAVIAALTGASVEQVTGAGTGIDAATFRRKCAVITRALAINDPRPDDPLGALATVGGFEIAGLVGVILGSAAARVPIVLDGLITGAAALVAAQLEPEVRAYLIAGHRSQEAGHRVVLETLGLTPLLDLGLRLGEGTGAVLAMTLVEAACRVLAEMGTFEDTGVSGPVP